MKIPTEGLLNSCYLCTEFKTECGSFERQDFEYFRSERSTESVSFVRMTTLALQHPDASSTPYACGAPLRCMYQRTKTCVKTP